jgi:glutamine amidotransferase
LIKSVAIVDYGTGNIASLDQAFAAIGSRAFLASTPADLGAAEALVLPGVGHFGPASRALADSGLGPEIRQLLQSGLPCLGICLGFQLLTLASEEAPGSPGLGLLPLHTIRITPANPRRYKVPHLGWNTLSTTDNEPTLLTGIPPHRRRFYFANAYAVSPSPVLAAQTGYYTHDQGWLGLVQQGSINAVQFHPEKSRSQGLQLLRNFLRLSAC